jgi:hypothetical protein
VSITARFPNPRLRESSLHPHRLKSTGAEAGATVHRHFPPAVDESASATTIYAEYGGYTVLLSFDPADK